MGRKLTLAISQAIAESLVGPVQWHGSEGRCQCPGIVLHTKLNAPSDCKVVCEPVSKADGILAPGVYCHHSSCYAETQSASFHLRSALGKRHFASARRTVALISTRSQPARPEFDPAKLERIARKLGGIDSTWLAARSKKRVDKLTPSSFLRELYRPGERVLIFDVFKSQGQALWSHRSPFNANELDAFRVGKPRGVWFLANPVTGQYRPNDLGKLSRRSWQTVTAWRYLVLESDKANSAHWLAALAQMPLPIAAIYTSGGKSIHALVAINAESKDQWNSIANELKPTLVTLGADQKAISAVRLTRLPCCRREEKRTVQTLLYLNGEPDSTPLCEKGEL